MEIIPSTVKLYGEVKIGEDVKIGDYTIIGLRIDSNESENKSPTIIGDKCTIGSHVVICGGRI